MDLRPLTLAELLDRAFSLYRRHVWMFAGIMATPAVLGIVWGALMQLPNFALQSNPHMTPPEVLRVFIPFFAAGLVFFVFYFVAYACAIGATTIAVSQIYLGRDATVKSAYGAMKPRLGRLILLMIWAALRVGGAGFGVAVAGSITAGIVAGVVGRPAGPILAVVVAIGTMLSTLALVLFMGVRYGVSVPAVTLEDQPASAALARSVDLTASNRWRVFLVILCAVVVSYATILLVQGPFMVAQMVAGPGTRLAQLLLLVGVAMGGLGSMFTGPVMIIGLVLIYYDLRIRKEAFDLQVMLEAIDR